MTEFQTKRVILTYFDILLEKGIPESKVANFYTQGERVFVVLHDGTSVDKPVKKSTCLS